MTWWNCIGLNLPKSEPAVLVAKVGLLAQQGIQSGRSLRKVKQVIMSAAIYTDKRIARL
jgi:hypothetical protein